MIPIAVPIVLLSSGVCMALVALVYRLAASRRFYPDTARVLQGREHIVRTSVMMVFSGACVLSFIVLLGERLMVTTPVPLWQSAVQAAAILIIYDFLYYFLHRFPFHEWGVLKRVHTVHHLAKNPLALDSMYLHPIENFLGLALLTFCAWLVGPVNDLVFASVFMVWSTLNIFLHSGVDWPIPFLGMMSRKHVTHHRSMRAKNYASITPLPDILFGTAE
jgi:sterol desaturase/sphingolipid hydroxylase (fatty acid hydroxylase superfamily)